MSDKPVTPSRDAPRPSKSEIKAETTHRIATGIIEEEAAARAAKTERLRAARLKRAAEVGDDSSD